jgi:hypothetical protein
LSTFLIKFGAEKDKNILVKVKKPKKNLRSSRVGQMQAHEENNFVLRHL